MVRRRTRAHKAPTETSNASVVQAALLDRALFADKAIIAAANKNLLEDQYFASPKRKDCKIDDGSVQPDDNGHASADSVSPESSSQSSTNSQAKPYSKQKGSNGHGKTKGERSNISARTIGVPLATRSQTRTIEIFFKAKTAAKNAKFKDDTEEEEEEKIHSEQQLCNGSSGDDANVRYSGLQSSSSLSLPLPLPLPPPTTTLSLESINCLNHYDNDHHHNHIRNHHNHIDTEMHSELIFELSEDTNDTDNTENSEEAGGGAAAAAAAAACGGPICVPDFITHRSALRDSHSSRSSTTDNIFLQEPVLTLNVDKSPNQASSIKINKSLDSEPIFSSPPSSLTSSALNGRFNQIVSLQGSSPSKLDSFGFESQSSTRSIFGNGVGVLGGGGLIQMPDNDNSSCDSGVVFGSSLDNSPLIIGGITVGIVSPSRRRKPATPHRIVCPSPIKTMPRVVSPALTRAPLSPSGRKVVGGAKEQLSPRKSQRQALVVNSKTRKRLNQQYKDQMSYLPAAERTKLNGKSSIALTNRILPDGFQENGHICADDAADDDEQFDELEDLETLTNSFLNGGQTKSILNSAKHPTAQQNTTNNNTNSTNNNSNRQLDKLPTKANKDSAAAKLKPNINSGLPKSLAASNGNRAMTDFFPVRRSVRKTKTAVKEEAMRNLEMAVLEDRADGLRVTNFEGKGRGIVADRRFERGEFVVEYVGDLISMTEASKRETRYALDQNAGCYMYYFKHKSQQYCIDATADTGKLGRLVNHSRNGNLMTKVIVVKQHPHLVLIAKDDIEIGEELTYDYGDRSKLSLQHHPWLAF